jgi:nucleoside-diphosphate-sugar epimerase
MNVLLTGGYGCIGSWMVRQLLQRGDRVWIYDLKEDPHRLHLLLSEEQMSQVPFVQGDVTDLDALKRTIDKHAITHVAHMAGLQVPTCRADPMLGARVNVLGTLAVFEAVKSLGPQIQRLVYASSAAVFGPQEAYAPSNVADEVHLMPTTHYGHYKVCNEGNARVYFQDNGVSSVGLRPCTVYGVGRDFGMTSEPTKAIKCLALGRPFQISYGGFSDMQYVEDVAATFIQCLVAPYQGAKAYNIRGEVVDMPAIHRAMCEVDPAAAKLITYGTKQFAIAYDMDESALQRDLGPMPRTNLVEGIRKTLAAFRKLREEGRLDTKELDG